MDQIFDRETINGERFTARCKDEQRIVSLISGPAASARSEISGEEIVRWALINYEPITRCQRWSTSCFRDGGVLSALHNRIMFNPRLIYISIAR